MYCTLAGNASVMMHFPSQWNIFLTTLTYDIGEDLRELSIDS